MKKTRFSVIIIALVVLVVAVFGILAGYSWFLNKMKRVDNGTARPIFPYADYSLAELNKLYPQYVENNAPTTQSPEQTHQLFVDTLKKGDFEAAVKCCFREGDQAKMKESLQSIKDKGQLPLMISDLDNKMSIGQGQDIEKNSAVTYYYSADRDGKKVGSTINFIKNSQGVWLIESL